MIDANQVEAALQQIKKFPKLYEQTIDELYRNHSLSHLEMLDLFVLNEDGIKDKETISTYVENKIENIKNENSLKSQQLSLDVKTKRRQLKAFYPLLGLTVLTGIAGIGSAIISYANRSDLKQKQDSAEIRLKRLEKSTLILPQTKMGDSMQTGTTQTHHK